MSAAETRACQNCKADFTIESDDFSFYERIKVPPPTFCPPCRDQRRLAFRNERALYKRKCDKCGEYAIGRFSPDKPYTVYCQKCWWSDDWDPLSWGKPYDFSRPFFEQYEELFRATPHISLLSSNSVNSEWINQETDDKNCYLNVGGHFNEDSAYNTFELYGKDCFDSYWLLHSELCYEAINSERCYRTVFSTECFDCRNTVLSLDCRNCTDIFGCAGLRNRRYCIFNKQYSKEGYEEFMKNNTLTSYRTFLRLRDEAEKAWLAAPRRYASIIKVDNATGNFITTSKNVANVWNVENSENSKHLYIAVNMKNSYDGSTIGWGELNYEGAHCGGLYDSKFFMYVFGGSKVDQVNSSFLEYCYATLTSNNCFGCANFKNKEYCILNKQYSKEEYEELLPKIKQHMMDMPYVDKGKRSYRYGEFFPIEFSPFGYNETVAQEYYPSTQEEAGRHGYSWNTYDANTHYEFSDYKIPDDISEVKDDILAHVLKCEASGRAYKIIPSELSFYRRMGLPIPRKSPLERHKERMRKLLPRKLFSGSCACHGSESVKGYKNTATHFHGSEPCNNTFQTSYAPDRPEIVYCEQCYQAEVS